MPCQKSATGLLREESVEVLNRLDTMVKEEVIIWLVLPVRTRNGLLFSANSYGGGG